MDTKALASAKPLLVYYYVDPVTDPMDNNYKFSSKFEQGVLQEGVIDLINKTLIAKKVALPADGDMKKVENQARIEIWSPTRKMIGRITIDTDGLLNKGAFIGFVKVRVAKSEKLVKDEIARIEKLRKENEARKSTETAKQD